MAPVDQEDENGTYSVGDSSTLLDSVRSKQDALRARCDVDARVAGRSARVI
jgi:hypothetical protein